MKALFLDPATTPSFRGSRIAIYFKSDGNLYIKRAHYAEVLIQGTAAIIPIGGTTGQILKKASADDYDTVWDAESPTSEFAAGTRLLFNQTAAPTGWTKETNASYNDAALRLVTGSVVTGGADAFSTHFGTGKSSAGFTLTSAELPTNAMISVSSSVTLTNALSAGTTYTNGGGGSHAHTLSSFNIKYADCIIAQKD